MNTKIALLIILGSTSMQICADGDPSKGAAISTACAICHGTYGLSLSDEFPNLAGQKAAYLVQQLKNFQTGKRLQSTMQILVGPLSDQNIEDLAAYYANNTTLPTYSSATLTLTIPFLEVASDLYQAELQQTSDSQFSLKGTKKLQ